MCYCRLSAAQADAVYNKAEEAWMSARAHPMHMHMLLSDRADWSLGQGNVELRFGNKVKSVVLRLIRCYHHGSVQPLIDSLLNQQYARLLATIHLYAGRLKAAAF
jgi:hypothetical protein